MRNNIQFQAKTGKEGRDARIQWMTIKTKALHVVCMYVPPDINIEKEMLRQIISGLGDRIIITGDLNGQSTTWGSSWTNQSGENITEFLDETNMVILNDGTRTRLTNNPNTISIPDIAICSPDLAPRTKFKVIQDTANSDHFPIRIDLLTKDNIQNQEHISNHKWNTRKANWEAYKEELQERLENNHITTYEELEDQINQVAEQTIPIRTQRKATQWKPIWWDGECDQMIQTRQQKIRDLWSNFTEEKYIETKKNNRTNKKIPKRKKETKFHAVLQQPG